MIANNLQRFIAAQQTDYYTALSEIKQGRKRSHWMWYIFPQIAGLGFSETSRYYALKSLDEAQAYLNNPILGTRLIEICTELLKLPTNNATQIFGTPDDMKLRSCATLFAALSNTNPVYQQVLDKFFNGNSDSNTLLLIGDGHH
ncbi:MAG: DUF1810 domain-containing protein [Sphingobacteriaceae bacterium]|nr:MAG: DUF1810 domain-containing protein [Sphingobacteriaceae bacterium]